MTTVRLVPSATDREVLRLAVPAFGALVAEPMFLLVDAAVVGRLGTAPLGGLGVAATLLATLVNVFVFLAYGTTAAVARRLGAGDRAAALRQGVDGLWLALGLGLLVAAAGFACAPALVDALGASAQVRPYALDYLRVALLGVPAMLVVLAGTGLLRGLQDTRTPLLVAGVGCAVNAVLNVVLVLGLGLGVAGSALGTVVVQVGSALVYVAVARRGVRAAGVSLRPDLPGVRAAARVGGALFVRTVALRAALVAATAVAARLGDAEVAAHQVAFGVFSLLALTLDALAIAAQALTGRSLGAGDVTGTRALTARLVTLGTGLGVVVGAGLLLASPWLPGLFSDDPAVRSALTGALVVVALVQPVAGVVFVLDGVLIGAGDARYLAVAAALSSAVAVALAGLVHALDAGLAALWLALGGWLVVRLVTLGVRANGTAWLVVGAELPRRA